MSNQFKAFVRTAGTEDFIFLLNLTEDTFTISEEALRFIALPSGTFDNAVSTITSLVHPLDKELFSNGLINAEQGTNVDFISEFRIKTPDQSYKPIVLRGKFLPFGNSFSILTGSIHFKQSHRDEITGLPMESQMITDFNNIKKTKGSVSGFILDIRIEGIEHINANYGLEVGDKVFNMVAKTCLSVCTNGTQAYRISGNKIAIMNTTGQSAADAQKLYTDLKLRVSDIEFDLAYSVVFTIAAGVVAFLNDRGELKDLIKKANFSLSMGKKNGKNNLYFFNSTEYCRHINGLSLREKLRESVKNNFRGFEMYYQPIVAAPEIEATEKGVSKVHIIGAEALLRWSDQDLGLVGADKVIPALEESGLMAPVGRWILMKSFTQCHTWNQYDKDFKISVNLSYVQFERSDVLFDVQCALEKSGVNPENITLEITESGYIDHDELQKLLDEFHKMKIKIDIDDFGTGYSNLRYLQNLHANTLKLDYSFVHKAVMGKEGDSERKVIEYIINMAHDLGMKVCLEGIESEEDIKVFSNFKPDKYQGYFFGKPVSSYAFLTSHKDMIEKTQSEDDDAEEPEEVTD